MWRRKPPPDSEVLVVSADGVMVHLLEEGWKEVRWRASRLRLLASRGRKQRAHCAWRSIRIELAYGMLKRSPTPTEPKVVVAGWKRPNGSSALTMAQSGSGRWSSSVLPVALNSSTGGHMLQYVWQIASEALGLASAEASAWVEAQKASLARGQLRLFFRRIAQLYPKGSAPPPAVRQAAA